MTPTEQKLVERVIFNLFKLRDALCLELNLELNNITLTEFSQTSVQKGLHSYDKISPEEMLDQVEELMKLAPEIPWDSEMLSEALRFDLGALEKALQNVTN